MFRCLIMLIDFFTSESSCFCVVTASDKRKSEQWKLKVILGKVQWILPRPFAEPRFAMNSTKNVIVKRTTKCFIFFLLSLFFSNFPSAFSFAFDSGTTEILLPKLTQPWNIKPERRKQSQNLWLWLSFIVRRRRNSFFSSLGSRCVLWNSR